MKILLLDNYDSFTYNLLHAVKELGATDVEVVRNDQIELDEVDRFDKIILSPGPGIPEEAGLLLPIIKRYAPTKSITPFRGMLFQFWKKFSLLFSPILPLGGRRHFFSSLLRL